jgi:tRNA(fMet)-specific endonuclease VapC
VICLEEIRFGTRIGPPGNKLWERIESDVLPHVTALPLDLRCALLAGDLRAAWKTAGTPVSYRDGLIAATARDHDLTLVTRNVRHFDHVSGLRIENWFQPSNY